MHLALVPGDTGRGSSSQNMAVFQTPSTQIEFVYEAWVRRFGLNYLWLVYLSAVRSEIGRGLEDFTNLLCEIHCFYGNNLISFLRSRPSTTCEMMLGIETVSSKEVKTDTPAECRRFLVSRHKHDHGFMGQDLRHSKSPHHL